MKIGREFGSGGVACGSRGCLDFGRGFGFWTKKHLNLSESCRRNERAVNRYFFQRCLAFSSEGLKKIPASCKPASHLNRVLLIRVLIKEKAKITSELPPLYIALNKLIYVLQQSFVTTFHSNFYHRIIAEKFVVMAKSHKLIQGEQYGECYTNCLCMRISILMTLCHVYGESFSVNNKFLIHSIQMVRSQF